MVGAEAALETRVLHRYGKSSREIGRVERTLFLLDWLADRDLQRRVQIGRNKGEDHPALKRVLSISCALSNNWYNLWRIVAGLYG